MIKARFVVNECPLKMTIHWQINESGELNNQRPVLFQGHVCRIVGDI